MGNPKRTQSAHTSSGKVPAEKPGSVTKFFKDQVGRMAERGEMNMAPGDCLSNPSSPAASEASLTSADPEKQKKHPHHNSALSLEHNDTPAIGPSLHTTTAPHPIRSHGNICSFPVPEDDDKRKCLLAHRHMRATRQRHSTHTTAAVPAAP
ncbi:Hypothetical predicted protein [Pelobates cultripes]|uniref:Uncharacterized protein n=1 Tax=Pelobates cultripes TaxID=61616 RepID=A0AAD1TPP7_PELCU|nr:Hypothetical predicted protein [Pelobates cultripes]